MFACVVLLLTVGAMNLFSFWLLASSCQHTGAQTYLQIGQRALGPTFGRLCQAFAVGYAVCSCISYVTLVGDFLVGNAGVTSMSLQAHTPSTAALWFLVVLLIILPAAALLLLYRHNARPPPIKYTMLAAATCALFLVSLCLWTPGSQASNIAAGTKRAGVLYGFALLGFLLLSLLRNIEPLKYLSGTGVLLTILVAVLCVCELMSAPDSSLTRSEAEAERNGQLHDSASWLEFPATGLVTAVPIINVAYTAHYNGPRYYRELDHPTMERFTRVLMSALSFTLVLYTTVACAGYAAFGRLTKGDLLLNFSQTYPPAIATRLAFLFILWSDFPKVMNGVREGILQLYSPQLSNDSAPLVCLVALTFVLVFSVTAVSVGIPQLQAILKFKGALSLIHI